MARHPFQCITAFPRSIDGKHYMLAAQGSLIFTIDIGNYKAVSRWQPIQKQQVQVDDGEDRPAKKQKLGPHQISSPNIITMATTHDLKHVVVATDDKCIRVLDIDGNGHLNEYSQRVMPKRPCTIKLSSDNASILVADKFGDVYSLPLFGLEGVQDGKADACPRKDVFRPSASNLTVHTERNRKALEAQLRQKEFSSRKEGPSFECELLLGHVSMLTDMVVVDRVVDNKRRHYIITADRDEHIRISRGPPQAYIIEGYCLGHQDFINKICIVPETTYLVSGGGDSWIGVWDWTCYSLQRKYYLDCDSAVSTTSLDEVNKPSVVSGIWFAPIGSSQGHQVHAVLIACERMSKLYAIPILKEGLEQSQITEIPLDHPPLDVACVGHDIIVSIDARSDGVERLRVLNLCLSDMNEKLRVHYVRDKELDGKLENEIEWAEHDISGFNRKLDDLLYGADKLRKRRDN
ncbi:hypothetical protein K470DRAFT_210738 [Piedraia hortae CBS 480.64]|uniref:Uncharacterized protein n=1 Tax=Piedraia hortae CBS 480.64 TaxID=1314780 RepID=A0A6A7C7E0_9PEZI|nr:hypothetical protein K470DRAFT_210738 [Piedraia hortae CBS 480.64]